MTIKHKQIFFNFWQRAAPLIFFLYRNYCRIFKSKNNKQRFSNNWASTHFSVWMQIFKNEGFVGREGVKYLEVGCYEGQSLFWILENVLTADTSKAIVIDIFGPKYGFAFQQNLAKLENPQKVEILQGYSRIKLRELPLNSFDIIYLDGSHSMADVMLDLALSWDLLKEGGLLIIDDYSMGQNLLDSENCPKKSVDTFIEGFRRWIDVIDCSYQCIIKKTGQLEESTKAIIRLDSITYDWYKKTLQSPEIAQRKLTEEEALKLDLYIQNSRMKNSQLKTIEVRKLLNI